jgi:hypothetical protein
VIALAGYYKNVDSNIGYTQYSTTINGLGYLITGPANGKGGYITGAEASLSTPFGLCRRCRISGSIPMLRWWIRT